ncbi:MAG: type III polyketide synthase [Gemmatimonadetes bacterium]|nr:type III polyketide synthase [Gemmatimonadota bacterium]MXX70398.1 type III polyketide synthase [Gemmatimonadota bacterium]MYC92171.1 type III polyketide synthase [Gemmatimonadota bacterium]MYG33886.1 type III polyketide synthase [Gemmatimonadota bacterium]MYJ18280.1 type III polyketide synthase [Gemmatimonadota bacterium]
MPPHNPTVRLNSLASGSAPYRYRQEELVPLGYEFFSNSFANFDRMARVYANAGIDARQVSMPLEWYRGPRTFSERNDVYIGSSLAILEEVATRCLDQARLEPAELGGLVVVSSTGLATPTLDALLMERLRLPPDIRRLPIFGLGCAGGVLGLARAAAMCRAEPELNVLFLTVELCSLTFQKDDASKGNVVAAALFGDGAAGAVLSTSGHGPVVGDWGEYTWPRSLDVMGWDFGEAGEFGVLFSRSIPDIVRRRFRGAVEGFLESRDLSLDDIDLYAAHPGGARVLDSLERALDLPPDALIHSREVLRRHGNMSAPTALFVLERALRAGATGRILLTSLGPGFTAAMMLIEA